VSINYQLTVKKLQGARHKIYSI